MESDQTAKRSVTAGVMRMNDGWPNVGYKFPNLPDSAKIVQLEGQILSQPIDVNPFT
jgi:hypothetical protein